MYYMCCVDFSLVHLLFSCTALGTCLFMVLSYVKIHYHMYCHVASWPLCSTKIRFKLQHNLVQNGPHVRLIHYLSHNLLHKQL